MTNNGTRKITEAIRLNLQDLCAKTELVNEKPLAMQQQRPPFKMVSQRLLHLTD